jgi:hypothetical protein
MGKNVSQNFDGVTGFNTLEYKTVVFGMPSLCMYGCAPC